MPDGADNFKGFYPTRKTAEAHERIFGPGMHAHDHDWGQNRTTDDAVPSGFKNCMCIWQEEVDYATGEALAGTKTLALRDPRCKHHA